MSCQRAAQHVPIATRRKFLKLSAALAAGTLAAGLEISPNAMPPETKRSGSVLSAAATAAAAPAARR